MEDWDRQTQEGSTFVFSSVRRAATKALVGLTNLLLDGGGAASPQGKVCHPIFESLPVGLFQQCS